MNFEVLQSPLLKGVKPFVGISALPWIPFESQLSIRTFGDTIAWQEVIENVRIFDFIIHVSKYFTTLLLCIYPSPIWMVLYICIALIIRIIKITAGTKAMGFHDLY